jgi:phage recombination protein Bet
METEANVTAISPVVGAARAMVRALEFSPDQRKMIRDTFASGASEGEFAVLMEVARARNLNPLLRQIHFVKRWDSQKRCEVWSTQISIDGLRAVAERTSIYAGQDEPEYEHNQDGKLICCKVRVYRKDWQRPAVGVAYFAEYVQTKKDGTVTQFWATKPHIMLAKCAEALAIRKAFPEDTAGLYTPEEMGEAAHAERTVEVAPETPRLPPKVEVLPPEPKKEPARAIPPAHVRSLWTQAQKQFGAATKTKFEEAARNVFGPTPKPSSEWTAEETAKVSESLFGPEDIQF